MTGRGTKRDGVRTIGNEARAARSSKSRGGWFPREGGEEGGRGEGDARGVGHRSGVVNFSAPAGLVATFRPLARLWSCHGRAANKRTRPSSTSSFHLLSSTRDPRMKRGAPFLPSVMYLCRAPTCVATVLPPPSRKRLTGRAPFLAPPLPPLCRATDFFFFLWKEIVPPHEL